MSQTLNQIKPIDKTDQAGCDCARHDQIWLGERLTLHYTSQGLAGSTEEGQPIKVNETNLKSDITLHEQDATLFCCFDYVNGLYRKLLLDLCYALRQCCISNQLICVTSADPTGQI